MSDATIQGIKDAIQAHIDDQREDGENPAFLLEFAVGYVTMRGDGEGREMYTYKYITDPHSTPHSSVGLFAMAAGQLDADLDPDHA